MQPIAADGQGAVVAGPETHQRGHKPVDIVDAILHAAEVAIPQKVVQLVRVQRAGYNASCQPASPAPRQKVDDGLPLPVGDKPRQVGRGHYQGVGELLMDLLSGAAPSPLSVLAEFLKDAFGDMREWSVADIV